MPRRFARRMNGVDVSGIRKMFEMAGKEAIHLGIGEPDFQPPPHVIDAYVQALREGRNKYGPSAGISELRSAIAKRYRRLDPEIAAEQVVVTAGSTQGLYAIMQAMIEPGDEVLCPDPGFVLYAPHVRLAGGTPVLYPLHQKHGFVPQEKDLVERISEKTRLLVTNSPSNPTGGVAPKTTVKCILDIAEEHDLPVISDEAYDAIVYDEPFTSFFGRSKDVILVNTFSKTYAMTGWRLGYTIAPKPIAEAIKKLTYHIVACPPTPSQVAAVAALNGPQEFIRDMVAEFGRRRDFIVKRLNAIPGFDCAKPDGAFYAFPSYTVDMPAQELAMEFLKAGVVTTPGDAFGPSGGGHMRFSYATAMENLERGMDIVGGVMRRLAH
ncbi:MAG: pyridoxal phosphate-dependent aminotransferase [Methanobacteriota archaeon]